VYVDLEGAITAQYRTMVGIPVDSDAFMQTTKAQTAEEALELVLDVVKSGQCNLVVVDSVSALSSNSEFQGEVGDAHIGKRAKLLAQCNRQLVQLLKDSDCAVILISQLRANVGAVGNAPKTYVDGGKSMDFFPTLHVSFARIKNVKEDGDTKYSEIEITTKKSRTSVPFAKTSFLHDYRLGSDIYGSYVDCGIDVGRVKVKGAWYYLDGESIGQGREKAALYLKGLPVVCAELQEAYRVKVNGHLGAGVALSNVVLDGEDVTDVADVEVTGEPILM
jgi:recombination protein RecA